MGLLESMADGYVNLEQVAGRKGEALFKPGPNATPEEKAAFNEKLGVPKTAEEYGLAAPEGVPVDEGLLAIAPQLFHGANLTKDQATQVMKGYNDHVIAQREEAQRQAQNRLVEGQQKVEKEYGSSLEEAKQIVDRTVRAHGKYLTAEVLEVLRDHPALGVEWTMGFLREIGKGYGEPSRPDGEKAAHQYGGSLTPDEADRKIQDLMRGRNPDFAKRLRENDAAAHAEHQRWHKISSSRKR